VPPLRGDRIVEGRMEHSITPAANHPAQAEQRLAGRITPAPALPADPAAQARVKDWLATIADQPAAAALVQILADHPAANELIAGFAEGAPYLWDLVRAAPARLLALLQSDPDSRLEVILAGAAAAAAATPDEAGIMALLRRMKAEAALLIALADAGGVWPVMRVTAALTRLADSAVGLAVRHLLREAVSAGAIKPADPSRPEQGSGYFVLAMGKMGAGELNYSSDIDIIVFFDPAAAALVPGVEPGGVFVRLTRQLVKMLQERTAQALARRSPPPIPSVVDEASSDCSAARRRSIR